MMVLVFKGQIRRENFDLLLCLHISPSQSCYFSNSDKISKCLTWTTLFLRHDDSSVKQWAALWQVMSFWFPFREKLVCKIEQLQDVVNSIVLFRLPWNWFRISSRRLITEGLGGGALKGTFYHWNRIFWLDIGLNWYLQNPLRLHEY